MKQFAEIYSRTQALTSTNVGTMMQSNGSTAVISFPAFEVLDHRRIETSNAIMAILAGSKMAANTLALTEGSSRTMGEIFPSVEHIQRFNLRTDEARLLLERSESDLCTMGMAYSIAVHEDFVKTCLSWLVPLGLITEAQVKSSNTFTVHERFAEASGHVFNEDSLALFHLTRKIRNCHIHAGGEVDQGLVDAYISLTPAQESIWTDLTKEPLKPPAVGDVAQVGIGGLIATLAIGKRLARDVNRGLQVALPREMWADIAAREYFALGAKKPNNPKALKSLTGFAKKGYRALNLTEGELADAIGRLV